MYRARLSLQDCLESEEQDVGTSPDHAGAAAAPADNDDTICDNGIPPLSSLSNPPILAPFPRTSMYGLLWCVRVLECNPTS